jgi:hypothetical protein
MLISVYIYMLQKGEDEIKYFYKTKKEEAKRLFIIW